MNRINGWQNHDSDVDIRKPLPWPDASASHIFIEHCVEHVDHKAAIAFFKEVHRVLAPGGVLRVTVPSLEMIRQSEDLDYFRFTTKWQKQGPTKRGAMEAIIYAHGHEMIWCASLMEAALFYSGFDLIEQCQPGKSKHQMLTGVEGHGKVIGDRFNAIESLCFEATKQGVAAPAENIRSVAIIIGGAINVDADVAKAEALCRDYRLTPEYFYTNDKIADFPGIGVAVTLHPDRLPRWMQDRRNKGLPEPTEIWCNRQQRGMNLKTRDDWRGSVGLFGVACAKDKGHDKILLCGIPMTMDAQHYLRRVQWPAAGGFQAGWRARLAEIAPFVRSLSGGWTEELLGAPTPEWLGLQQAAVAA